MIEELIKVRARNSHTTYGGPLANNSSQLSILFEPERHRKALKTNWMVDRRRLAFGKVSPSLASIQSPNGHLAL